jgi:hypothetical protein
MLAKGYRALCAGIVTIALQDIEGSTPVRPSSMERESAMGFFYSEYFRLLCDFANLDCCRLLEKAISTYEKCNVKNGCFKTY